MKHEVPAPGYVRISGKRKPPASMGTHLWCIIRGGENGPVIAKDPWPVHTCNWIHDGGAGDIIAIKRVEE